MSSSSSRSEHSDADADAAASAELKLYRAFIFSAPIFFTFILLFLFYRFYLRPRRVDWSSLRMRSFAIAHETSSNNNNNNHNNNNHNNDATSTCDLGLKKELREMLPIVVYKESFSVKDTLCSVCLVDYRAEDRLQQIPACGHTFHMSCIDLWLASHSTCPLCRVSLLTWAKSSAEVSDRQRTGSNEETQAIELSESRSTMHQETIPQDVFGEVVIAPHCIDVEGENRLNNQ